MFGNYKPYLALIAVLVGFAGFVPYLRDIFIVKTTKPHFFSWFLWGILETVAFFGAASKGAGAGAAALLLTAILCFVIATKAFSERQKSETPWMITRLDVLAFILSVCAIILWSLTKNPLNAIIIVAIADAIAFVPTYRKAWQKPNEETISEFVVSILKNILGLLALRAYNLTTWLYPASLILTNLVFVIMVSVRRKSLNALMGGT